jgi:hypothetical protein
MDLATPEPQGGGSGAAALTAGAPSSVIGERVAWLSTAAAKTGFFSEVGAKAKSRWIQTHCCIPGPTAESKLWSISPHNLFSYTSKNSRLTQRAVHTTAIDSIADRMHMEGLYEDQWQGQNEDVFCMAANHPHGVCECCAYWSLPDNPFPGKVCGL